MKKQRVLAALLALVMLVGLLPVSALAVRRDDQALPLEAPAEEPSAQTAATPAAAADPAALPDTTADASGSVADKAYSEQENAYEIYPVPHSVVYPSDHSSFQMTTDVNVVVGAGVDEYTTDFLTELLERFDRTVTTSTDVAVDKTNIVLAIHGSGDTVAPASVNDLWTAADKYDPYLLKADNGTITIIGKDTDCVYYGVATLQMMFTSFNGEKFLNATIEDYANTALRGFIEGFYGGFTYEGRESQMRSIRDVKGNLYVFSSKTDTYHAGSNWATLYPEAELNQIKDLVTKGKKLKVDYAWSIHIGWPGGKVLDGIDNGNEGDDFLNTEVYNQRLTAVQAKFQQLYDAGVRNFHILNDDQNSGTHRVQVKFLNDINAWLKAKGDCGPLVYCCSGYNKGWAQGGYGGNGTELPALRALDSDIYLYWTGDAVNAPMTQASVTWPHTQSNHQVVTWLNYPCSEHDSGTGIYLGDISYYVSQGDGLTGQYGFLSNAIASPEANKVAYFQLLSWCWNRDDYTSYLETLWEDCFKYLQPEVYEAYLTIARNVSNCPNSGRVGPFRESEYLTETLERVQTALLAGDPSSAAEDTATLKEEFDHILAAVTTFRANCANTALVAELDPWLNSLRDVATAGKQAVLAAEALAVNDIDAAWNAFAAGGVALGTWYTYPSTNPYMNGNVKSGSRRLQPFANTVLNDVEEAMAQQFNPGGGLGGRSFYAVLHGVQRTDDANSAKIFDGNTGTFASYHDGTGNQQQANDYYGVDLGGVKLISAVDILQGNSDTDNDYFHVAALEVSSNGTDWTTLVTKVNSHHIHVDGLDLATRYVRLRLLEKGFGNKQDFWTHIREFTVTEKAPQLLYTNVSDPGSVTVQADGGVYTLTAPSLTLAANEYVGIMLPGIAGVKAITAGDLPDGVKLQYSVSGERWTEVPSGGLPATTVMGYIRLMNTGSGAAALSSLALTATEPARVDLSCASHNLNLYSGSVDNLVDGDHSSQLYTNGAQTAGQHVIVDLGARQSVHDIALYFNETSDCPHHLSISVGDTPSQNGAWTVVKTFADADKVIEPPYGKFTCDANGQVARYVKVEVTAASAEYPNQWMKLNELEVNKTVAQEDPLTAVTASSGVAANADDGDLLTFCAPGAGAGYWEKLLQAPTALDGVTVLRGEAGASATVKVQRNDTWTELGALTQSAVTLSLKDQDPVTGVRIEWAAGDVPAIAEVIFGAAVPTGTTPTLYPNIYDQPANPEDVTVANGTAVENIPLPDQVRVTTSGGTATDVPVQWSCGSYDALTAGAYPFTGRFDLADALLTNPGCFTLSATVTVRPAEGSATPEGDLVLGASRVFASGQENSNYVPSRALTADNYWGSNVMKTTSPNALIDNSAAWIVVDLQGDGTLAAVHSISEISVQYWTNKAWPTKYVVQVAGDGFTPVDYASTNGSKSAVDAGIDPATYSGNNAKDAACWTTIATFDRAVGDNNSGLKDTLTAAQLSQIPANARYLRLYFTEINLNAAAATSINVRQIIVKGTRTATPVSPNITSITPVTAIGVVGDEWASLNLPTHVVASLADGTKARIPVEWNSTDYDKTAQTAQTFSGTLTLPAGVTNNDSVAPQLTVTLSSPPDVTGFTVTPSRVAATHHTAFAALEPTLPANAVLQFSNGATRVLPVTWDESSYDPDSLADQTVTGTVIRPWSKTEYTVSVLVRLDPILATSVTVSPKTLTLFANTSHADHTATLTAAVGGDDASDKTVTWSSSDVHVAAVENGVVTAVGTGTATVYAVAHDGSRVSDSCAVTVKWALEGNVTVSGGTKIGSTLTADLNSFVQDAKQSIDIQWQRKGKDETEFTPISGATEKDFTVAEAAANVGAQYKVVITGKGLYDGTSQSLPITMTKLDGQPLKAVPTFTNVSAEGATDGEITGLFKGRKYEYKQVENGTVDPGETGWIPFSDMTGDETGSAGTFGTAKITGLGVGTYVIRRAADDLHEAGVHRTVTIAVRGAANVVVNNPHTFEGGTVTVGRTQIPEGDTVRLTVAPATGYELVPDSLKAIPDAGEAVIAAADPTTAGLYTFTMPRGIASVTISAQFRLKTYTIDHQLTHISCNMAEHNHTATHGETFSITLTPDEGYEMTPTTVTVTNADTHQPFTDYTYLPDTADPAKRVLTFAHGVTCNIAISGEAVLKSYLIDDQLVDLTCNLGDHDHHKVSHHAALTIVITPAEGYILPAAKEDITITMGGEPFTDFTYTVADAAHGQIAIAAGKITGDLTVSAAAGISLTSAAIYGTAQVGERLSADVRPSNATVTCLWTLSSESSSSETFSGDTFLVPASAEGKTITLTVTGTGRYKGTLTTDPAGPIAPAIADKAALRAAYDDGLTVANDNYTAATWDAFQKALADAATVLDTAAATQAQVDDALAVLNAARAGLKKQTSSRPSGGGTTPAETTKTETRDDGAKVTTVTKPDGSTVETVEQPDGAKSETVTAKDGAVTITVTDAEGEELAKVELPAEIPTAETRFDDVPEGHWADEAIHNAAALKLVNGVGDNKFDMVSPMTRGSLATVLHRLSQGKTDYVATFQDVAAGKFYTEGVAWAAKAGVVTGYTEDIFAPDDVITREQLAVMLARYAKLIGMDTKADAEALDKFADGEKTGSWATDGMAWCVANGILQGKGGNTLDPNANVTRAEVAVMLDRFIALIK